VEYATQFKKPVIALEDLTHIRRCFRKKKKSKKLNRRMNSLPFRKLQAYIEYKALRINEIHEINPIIMIEYPGIPLGDNKLEKFGIRST
jgi:IS605 OrfB family transposase